MQISTNTTYIYPNYRTVASFSPFLPVANRRQQLHQHHETLEATSQVCALVCGCSLNKSLFRKTHFLCKEFSFLFLKQINQRECDLKRQQLFVCSHVFTLNWDQSYTQLWLGTTWNYVCCFFFAVVCSSHWIFDRVSNMNPLCLQWGIPLQWLYNSCENNNIHFPSLYSTEAQLSLVPHCAVANTFFLLYRLGLIAVYSKLLLQNLCCCGGISLNKWQRKGGGVGKWSCSKSSRITWPQISEMPSRLNGALSITDQLLCVYFFCLYCHIPFHC